MRSRSLKVKGYRASRAEKCTHSLQFVWPRVASYLVSIGSKAKVGMQARRTGLAAGRSSCLSWCFETNLVTNRIWQAFKNSCMLGKYPNDCGQIPFKPRESLRSHAVHF